MANLRLGSLLRYIRHVAATDEAPLSDRQLLGRFAATHDQAAFAALVERHGGLVAGVCRRMLRDGPDAEDVFQATFLVLARKAAAIGNPDALAGWLYGVALRLARKVRAQAARRARLPAREVTMSHEDPMAEVATEELREVLDEELGRLPARYRDLLILCYLEGKSRGEAARQLGWSEGAVKGKLERGRELLRGRLTRRGLAVSAASLAALLEQPAFAQLPPGWAEKTVASVTLFLAGKLPPGTAAGLADALLRAMATARLQVIIAALAAVGLAAVVAGVITHGAMAANPQPAAPEPPAAVWAAEPKQAESRPVAFDLHGDPLPPAAVARLGTERLHHAGSGPVAFSRDGKNLISLGVGGLVVWDLATGKELRQIPLPQQEFTSCFQVSPDGSILATASLQGTIRLWDTATGKPLREFGVPRRRVESLAFAADGKTLVACSTHDRGIISFWDTASGALIGELANQAQVNRQDRYALAPDGKAIVSWHDGDSSVPTVWEVNPAGPAVTRRQIRSQMKHGGAVSCAALSPDARFLVAASAEAVESQIRVWDLATGKEVRRLAGYGGGTLALVVSPDGKSLVSAGMSKQTTVKEVGECITQVRELETGKEVCRLRWPGTHFVGTPMRGLIFSPDGKSLAARHWSAILLWNAATGEPVHPDSGSATSIARATFSPDGRLIATSATSGSPPIGERIIRLWDAQSGKEVRRLEGHTTPPRYVVFSPDGQTLATGSDDQTIRLWEVATGKELHRISIDPFVLAFLGFGPGGKTLIYQSGGKPVRIWSIAEQREVRQVTRDGVFNGAALTPDGKTLLIYPAQGAAILYDLETGKEVTLEAFRQMQGSYLAFSPNGRMLAGIDRSRRTVYLWDTRTGQRSGSLAVGCRALFGSSVAFSPDGKMLAVGDPDDNVVHLCDPATGREVGRFPGRQGGVWSVAYSADGKRLASGGGDATTVIWDITAALPPVPPNVERTPRELEVLWTNLASPSDYLAYQALWDLVDSPGQAVPLFRDRLRPAPVVDAKIVAGLVADLDAAGFEVREKATAELEKLGDSVEQALHKVLEEKPALEMRQRVEALLKKLNATRPERQRQLRGVEVLEHVGTREAREVLDGLTRGRPDSPLTSEAKAAFHRLGP